MAQHEQPKQNEEYQVPDYILEGDFRKPKGTGDVDRFYAHDIVQLAHGDSNDAYLVDEVYGELAKAREAFREIDGHLKAGMADGDAYTSAGRLFEERIEHIIHGETELHP